MPRLARVCWPSGLRDSGAGSFQVTEVSSWGHSGMDPGDSRYLRVE